MSYTLEVMENMDGKTFIVSVKIDTDKKLGWLGNWAKYISSKRILLLEMQDWVEDNRGRRLSELVFSFDNGVDLGLFLLRWG